MYDWYLDWTLKLLTSISIPFGILHMYAEHWSLYPWIRPCILYPHYAHVYSIQVTRPHFQCWFKSLCNDDIWNINWWDACQVWKVVAVLMCHMIRALECSTTSAIPQLNNYPNIWILQVMPRWLTFDDKIAVKLIASIRSSLESKCSPSRVLKCPFMLRLQRQLSHPKVPTGSHPKKTMMLHMHISPSNE